ncbi:MAG: hypothetical protein HZC12_01820 [Nitrospirae bacterium]|nr:hypothetical protein [Nitrospirota bacterium]
MTIRAALYPEEAVEEELHSWRKAIRFLLSLAKTSFHAFDHTQRLEEIKETLRNKLRVWLGRIKERLESSVRVSDQA